MLPPPLPQKQILQESSEFAICQSYTAYTSSLIEQYALSLRIVASMQPEQANVIAVSIKLPCITEKAKGYMPRSLSEICIVNAIINETKEFSMASQ